MDKTITSTGCCEPFDPAPWDDKIIDWNKKKFVKDNVFTLFYIPLNFSHVMTRLMSKIESGSAKPKVGLCLCDHTSKWNMDLFVAVNKEVPGLKNTALSGRFLSKVYEGDFKETGKWCKDFYERAKDRGYDIKKHYMSYTTCPACAKKYGKNYVVVIGKIV